MNGAPFREGPSLEELARLRVERARAELDAAIAAERTFRGESWGDYLWGRWCRARPYLWTFSGCVWVTIALVKLAACFETPAVAGAWLLCPDHYRTTTYPLMTTCVLDPPLSSAEGIYEHGVAPPP